MKVSDNNEVRTSILKVAKACFMAKGYLSVSMRQLSREANISLGNIYYYFKSKDELFCELVRPAVLDIKNFVLKDEEPEYSLEIMQSRPEEYMDRMMKESFYSIFRPHGDEFYLLFYCSSGSSLENYDRYVQKELMKRSISYFDQLKEKYPEYEQVSHEFLQVYLACFTAFMRELVKLRDIPKKKYDRLLREFIQFTIPGWKNVMKV